MMAKATALQHRGWHKIDPIFEALSKQGYVKILFSTPKTTTSKDIVAFKTELEQFKTNIECDMTKNDGPKAC